MLTDDLKPGERLLLDRRRRRESQPEAAARHGVSRYLYRRWELGLETGPRVSLGRIRAFEECFLLRHRAGVPVKDLADAMGVSRWWLIQMEYGDKPAERLVETWSDPKAALRRLRRSRAPRAAQRSGKSSGARRRG